MLCFAKHKQLHMIETKLQLDSGRSSEKKMRRWVQKIISREEFSVTMFLTGQTDGETDRLLSYTCHLMISVRQVSKIVVNHIVC